MRHALLLLTLITAISCDTKLTDPEQIITRAITAAGGTKYENSTVTFDFRDRHYVARHEGGTFSYERIFRDSVNTIHDVLSNTGFQRTRNDSLVTVPDSLAALYGASVNSVVYFALLPFKLNDAAVQKKFLGEATIKGIPCYQIEVTFQAEGGGEDHEDVFYYWFDQKDFSIRYLAYSFKETNIGYRFREAYNPRKVDNVLFLDYVNYQPTSDTVQMSDLVGLFETGQLKQLSRIELTNIEVN
jgi:hypothetical protein